MDGFKEKTSFGSVLRSLPALAIVGVAIIYSVAIFLTGPHAWDDGAITVAFARTFGLTGSVALTGASEVVEGSSSLFYMLLLSVPFVFTDISFPWSVSLAQTTTFAFVIGLLLVTQAYLRPKIEKAWQRNVILLLIFGNPLFLAEILNGMEMAASAFFFALFLILYERRSNWVFAVMLVLLLCRFEFIFYLGLPLLILWIIDAEDRYFNFRLGVGLGLLFAAITLVRFLYFGDIMPNTIWAKMHYGSATLAESAFAKAFRGGEQFVAVMGGLLLIAAVVIVGNARWWKDIKLWIVLSVLIFAMITGPNLGYTGRMFLIAVPVAIFLLVDQAFKGQLGLGERVFSLLVLGLLALLYTNQGLIKSNLATIMEGAYRQEILSADALGPLLPQQALSRPGATPDNYYQNGRLLDALREELDLETLVVSLPDIGGIGLCCDPDALRVVDSALLANSVLAHEGYGGFAAQFAAEQPDAVLTHAFWAQNADIYNLTPFVENYQPVVVGDMLLWLRRDLVAQAVSNTALSVIGYTGTYDYPDLRNDLRDSDLSFLEAWTRQNGPVLRLRSSNF